MMRLCCRLPIASAAGIEAVAGLHLDEHEHAAPARHDIDLAERRAENVRAQDAVRPLAISSAAARLSADRPKRKATRRCASSTPSLPSPAPLPNPPSLAGDGTVGGSGRVARWPVPATEVPVIWAHRCLPSVGPGRADRRCGVSGRVAAATASTASLSEAAREARALEHAVEVDLPRQVRSCQAVRSRPRTPPRVSAPSR